MKTTEVRSRRRTSPRHDETGATTERQLVELIEEIGLARFQSRIDSGEVDAEAGNRSIQRYIEADKPLAHALASLFSRS